MPDGAQALVRVVLPVEQAVLTARGHHAVRFVGALGHQIVNQGPDVAVLAVQDKGALPFQLPCRVYPGNKPLYRRFLITGGAVKLPRAEKSRDFLRFQCRAKLRRVNAVILDGIRRSGHLRLFQSRYGVQHLQLHFLRHGGGKALDIEFLCVEAHRLNEELVARLIREGHDLCLDAGAIARPDPLDDPRVDRAAVQIPPDNFMSLGTRPGQVTDRTVLGNRFGGE